ncbi:hypothetical protein C8J57DRAFT_1326486 [Mycena rebaudengoi]|nr:hypothetical protein C8J57DRAFT_1326486 [Mycena rebaudengoi]
MKPEYAYTTHALPDPRTCPLPPSNFTLLAQKYAAVRLEALLTSPSAFGSTYAIESRFTAEEWEARVWRSDAVVLVCVANPVGLTRDLDEETALLGDWVGIATLRGPLSAQEYELPPEAQSPPAGSDNEETKWQMTAVFASVAHRGRGLAKQLIQAGKEYALRWNTRLGRELNSPLKKVRLRVMIHPDNHPAIALYSSSGFVDAGRATGHEAYQTNGDLAFWGSKMASLTTEEERLFWTIKRVAIVMEWVDGVEV